MMMATEHAERLAQLRDELAAAVAHDDPLDVDGSRLASIASAAAWAFELAQCGRGGTDPGGFHARTGATWAQLRAEHGDCPRAASRAWARLVLQTIGKRS